MASSIDDDSLGLSAERRILASGVREIFTPHQPVSLIQHFVGRKEQRNRLVAALNTPGQHAILYGERGVGKSSLALIASSISADYLKESSRHVLRCDSQTTFGSIATSLLTFFDADFAERTTSETKAEGGDAGLDIKILKAGVNTKTTRTASRKLEKIDLTPGSVVTLIGDRAGIIVIDEFDALRDTSDRHQIAELVKQLSDSGSSLKLLLVGISDSPTDLMAGHPSVHRCLREVRLGLMSDRDLQAIVEKGAKRVRRSFSETLVKQIVDLSNGYPYFTHLLSLKCAEAALIAKERYLTQEDLDPAAAAAVDDAEQTLRVTYYTAVRSANTPMYRYVVEAAATLVETEFTTGQLLDRLRRVVQKEVSSRRLGNYLRRLVGEDGERIFRRMARGVYRFSDPRMRSFALIAIRGKR